MNAIDRELGATRRAAIIDENEALTLWASEAQATAQGVRTALLRADDALRGLAPLEALRIARAIERRELILLIGPERTTALGVRTLVPDAGATGADAVRLVREGENALATALASAAVEHPPIVVLVHAAQRRLLDDLTCKQIGLGLRTTRNVPLFERDRSNVCRPLDQDWFVILQPAFLRWNRSVERVNNLSFRR